MQTRKVWSAATILGNRVRAQGGEDVGKIEDLVLDPTTQRILYAVLSVEGYPELFVVPWALVNASLWPDYMLLNIDKNTLERAPSFNPADWPDRADVLWEQRVRDYYRVDLSPTHERTVHVERNVPRPRREMPVLGGVVLVLLLLGLLWVTFLVSTRGWDGAKRQIASSFQGAAYAMKETSQDAALTAKVKTALSLSKRIPANQINVDSEGDVVTLRGEVPTDEIRTLAEKIALDTPGVREVHNHLYALQHTQ